MLLNIKFVQLDFITIEGGVSELVYPVAEDGHGAVTAEGYLLRQMNVPDDIVLHLGVLSGVLVAEGLQSLAAHLFEPVLFGMWACNAVLLRPTSGDGVSPSRMHAGI